MGKSIDGKELGRGISQRKTDKRYEARCMINGVKVCVYDMHLPTLKKKFEMEKAKLLREEKNVRPNLTLKEWWEEFFENHKAKSLKSETSRKAYYRKVNNTYITELGDKKLETITHMNIQATTNYLVEKFKPRTVREGLGVLRECMDIAVINSLIKTNPCVNIAINEQNEAMQERRVLDKREIKMLLEEVEHEYYNELYQIMLLTGMRIGEVGALTWDNVDFQKKVVRIRKSLSVGYVDGKKIEYITPPKTSNSIRSIPFFDNVGDLFKSWKKKQDEYKARLGERWRAGEELGDLVFTTTLGSPVTRYALAHNMEKVLKNINDKERYNAEMECREPHYMEHIYPHCLRHTCATLCFERGLDAIFIQRMLGHVSYETTMVYTHLLESRTNEEVAKTKGFLSL